MTGLFSRLTAVSRSTTSLGRLSAISSEKHGLPDGCTSRTGTPMEDVSVAIDDSVRGGGGILRQVNHDNDDGYTRHRSTFIFWRRP